MASKPYELQKLRCADRLVGFSILFWGYLSCDRHLPCALLGEIKPGALRFCFPSKFMVYGLWLMFFKVWGGKASVFRNSSQVDSYEDGIGVIIQTRSNLKRNRRAEQDDSVWVDHSFPLRTVCRGYGNGHSPLLSVLLPPN